LLYSAESVIRESIPPKTERTLAGQCAGICKPPDFIGVGTCRYQQPAAVVAVEMWEPAFGAGFQARWDGQQIFGQDAARGPTERHFHSEPGILPILMRILSLAAAQDQNVRFQKPAQNEHFYRLSCRAVFTAHAPEVASGAVFVHAEGYITDRSVAPIKQV